MKLKQILKELISIDSTSRLSNEPIISWIEDFFEGTEVKSYRLKSHEKGKFNLLLVKGPPSENGLTLCGHMDTVPASQDLWESDPWELSERNGNWYARGSCDMKGFLAIAIQAIQQAEIQQGCLAVLLLCDEELGSFGAKHIIENGVPFSIPKQVIIGEPTSLKVVRLHKGHLSMKVTIDGLSAHTGSPHLGKNALVEGGRIICALSNLSKKLESSRTRCSEYFAEAAKFPILSVSTVKSGEAINVVPDKCEIGIGIRLLPDQVKDELVEEIRRVISDNCDLSWKLIELGDNPTMLTAENAPINNWFCNYIDQSVSLGVSYGTDGGYLSRDGYQCILFGPGDIAFAHKPDEFVPIIEMEQCAQAIDSAVSHFCGDMI